MDAWLCELESERPSHPRQVAVMRAHEARVAAFWETRRVLGDDAAHWLAWGRAVAERGRWVDEEVEAAIAAYSKQKRDALRGGKAG